MLRIRQAINILLDEELRQVHDRRFPADHDLAVDDLESDIDGSSWKNSTRGFGDTLIRQIEAQELDSDDGKSLQRKGRAKFNDGSNSHRASNLSIGSHLHSKLDYQSDQSQNLASSRQSDLLSASWARESNQVISDI